MSRRDGVIVAWHEVPGPAPPLRDALADILRHHLAKTCCKMSRRDGVIVAWHEVPGPAPPLRDALADILRHHLAKTCCKMSRRDGVIVAWHEVPGKNATPKEPSRRVRSDSRRCAHRFENGVTKFSKY